MIMHLRTQRASSSAMINLQRTRLVLSGRNREESSRVTAGQVISAALADMCQAPKPAAARSTSSWLMPTFWLSPASLQMRRCTRSSDGHQHHQRAHGSGSHRRLASELV